MDPFYWLVEVSGHMHGLTGTLPAALGTRRAEAREARPALLISDLPYICQGTVSVAAPSTTFEACSLA